MSAEFEIKDKYTIEDLVSIVKVLRAPGGCPWDRAQTHDSIKKNFIEETYEVVEAINKQDTGGLKEELGDILLQVALHSEMESEKGNFDFNDVANDIVKKLVFRHPHVFGSVQADDVDSALNSWDSAKQVEKSIKSQTDSMLRVSCLRLCVRRKFSTRRQKSASIGMMSAVQWTNFTKKLMS